MSSVALDIALELRDKASAALKRSVGNMESSIAGLDLRMSRTSATVAALGAAFSGWQLARLGGDIVRLSDTYTMLDNRLRLVTTSEANLTSVREDLYKLTIDTHGSLESTVGMYSRFARATEGLDLSQQDLLSVTRAVNEAILVSGATSQEADAAILQLSQGMASGVLRGQELNSVMEQTPRIARMIADGMGITIGQLREYGKAGKLTSEDVLAALKDQADVVHDEFGRMAVTVGQSWQDVKTVFAGIINDGSEAASVTDTLSGSLQDLTTYLNENKEQIAVYFEVVLSGFTDLVVGAGKFLDVMVKVDEFLSGKKHGSIKDAWADQQVQKIEAVTIAIENLKKSNQPGKEQYIARMEQQLSLLTATMDVYQMELAETIAGEIELEGAVEQTGTAMTAGGNAATKAAKEVCEANKKKLTCAERALKKEVDAAVQSGREMKDLWQVQAADKYDVQARALQASVDLQAKEVDSAKNYWVDFSESTKDVLHDFVESGIKLEFDSIDDAFSSLTDSLLNMFADMLAQMVANWAASGIMGMMTGQGFSGFSMPSFSPPGGSGGPGIPSVSGSASGMGTVGGSLAVAGGAYGMYQGGRDVSNGNYFQGGAEMVAGGYSMYQGGVTLGAIQPGTATAVWDSATGGWTVPGFGSQSTVQYGVSGTQTLGSTGGTVPGQAPAYLAASGGYGGSVVAGQQTYLAAQGAYSGVGASGIGSGQGMMASYAGAESAGAGAGAGAGGAAGGAGAGAAAMTSFGYAAMAAIAYKIFSGILEMDEATPHSALSMLSAAAQDQRTGAGSVYSGDPLSLAADQAATLSDAIDKMYTNMLEGANNLVDGWGDHIQGAVADLSDSFNVAGVEQFTEAMAGFDVTSQQAATALDLANLAANGNLHAVDDLTGYFVSLGMTIEQASAATSGLLEAERRHGNVVETTMDQVRRASESMSGVFGTVTDAQRKYTEALHDVAPSMFTARKSILESSYAVEQLNAAAQDLANTDINMQANATIRVDVLGDATATTEITGASNVSSYQNGLTGYGMFSGPGENYDGGIFLARSLFRPGQTIAERGPEAAIPLHEGKDTLKKMHDDIKAGKTINNNISLKIEIDGQELDARIVEVSQDHIGQQALRQGVTV